VALPGDDIVTPERKGLAIARQLEELAKVVKEDDEKVDIETNFSYLSMKCFKVALQLTGAILVR
jgi:hypothetical protein